MLKSPIRSQGDCIGGSINFSSSRKAIFRSRCDGAYTFVTKMLCGDARHDSVKVDVKRLCWQLMSENHRELVAERMPPVVPDASR